MSEPKYFQADTADRLRPTDLIKVDRRTLLVEGMDHADERGRVRLLVSNPSGSLADLGSVITLSAWEYVEHHRSRMCGYRGPLAKDEVHTSVADAQVANGWAERMAA